MFLREAKWIISLFIFSKHDIFRINKESRLGLWKASKEIIGNSPILGVGAHNVISEISNSGNVGDNVKFRKYNAHNQFLEIAVGKGSIGIILLLALFYYPLRFSINKSYLNFITIASFIFLFESFLNRQAGMSTFAFWSVYFYNTSIKSNWDNPYENSTLITILKSVINTTSS